MLLSSYAIASGVFGEDWGSIENPRRPRIPVVDPLNPQWVMIVTYHSFFLICQLKRLQLLVVAQSSNPE